MSFQNNFFIKFEYLFYKYNFFLFFFNKTPMHLAVLKNNVDMVNLLLQRKDIDLNAVDEIFYFESVIEFHFFVLNDF